MGGDGEGLKRGFGRNRPNLTTDKSGRSPIQLTLNDPSTIFQSSVTISLVIRMVSMAGRARNRIFIFLKKSLN